MNQVCLIGRTVREPEVRYNNELAIAKFTVAIDRQKTKTNQDPGADFPNVVAFGKTAELIEKYIGKGRLIGIQGRLQTGSYEGKDGKKVYFTQVVADRVFFLDRAGDAESTPRRNSENNVSEPSEEDFSQETIPGFSKMLDDIPF